VASEAHLRAVLERIGLHGIRFAVFHEPDDEMGFTAACTEPLDAKYRREFRALPLWTLPGEEIKM
jgi:hypothetical protein